MLPKLLLTRGLNRGFVLITQTRCGSWSAFSELRYPEPRLYTYTGGTTKFSKCVVVLQLGACWSAFRKLGTQSEIMMVVSAHGSFNFDGK